MEHVNAEILRAIANGEKVQYRNTTSVENCNWKDFEVKNIEACWSVLTGTPVLEWRIAPKTVKIGDYEVPEPCREVPETGQKVWAIHPINQVEPFTWYSSKACLHALDSGFVHLTEEAARQHYEAIKNLLGRKHHGTHPR